MKRKASLWNIGIIAFLTLIVLLLYVNYYSSRTSLKNMHYSFLLGSDLTQNMNYLINSMFYASVPGLNYTYLDLLVMATVQKYKEGESYEGKVYVGEPIGYVFLEDIIFSIFDDYFGKGNWNLTVIAELYGDELIILTYGYEVEGKNVYSVEVFAPLYYRNFASEIKSIRMQLYVF